MFNSKTYFLFTILTILPKSRSSVTTAIPNETLSDGLFQYETYSDNKKFEGFIVGGQNARIKDFPHSAFLAIKCQKIEYEDFTCGASILNQVILLTAAHCFENCESGTKVLVSVGDRRKSKGTLYNVGQFAKHKEYTAGIMKNDIAVAILTEPLVFSSTVKRVLLSRFAIYNEPAQVAGWGVINDTSRKQTLYLKWTRQVVLSPRKCLILVPKLSKGYICASGDENHDNDFGYAAVGDSGSALIVRGSIQIGIVSYKIPKISKSLVLYTDVTKYIRWITSISKQLYCRQFKFT